MKALWQVTSSRIGLLFVAFGVLLTAANDRSYTKHVRPTSNLAE